MEENEKESVQVFARFRPKIKREAEAGSIYKFSDVQTIQLTDAAKTEFTFDRIFNEQTTQNELYESVAQPILHDFLQGFNCTIIAYGQTGAGKTHTLSGNNQNPGIVPRILDDLFVNIQQSQASVIYTVQCSYVEIYMEKIRDLLNPELTNLRIREIADAESLHNVYIENCTLCTVKNSKEILKMIQKGDLHRSVAATDMNLRSSRSHSVVIVSIVQTDIVKQIRKSSKLFLVDLAGSEDVSRSKVSGLGLDQAKTINKSLSALSLVIKILTEHKSSHIPYRDSKLTRLLSNSLGGNSKTALLLALSPASDSLPETLSTLKFGARAKKMKNCAKINEEMSVGSYKKLLEATKEDLEFWKMKCVDLEKQIRSQAASMILLEIEARQSISNPVVIPPLPTILPIEMVTEPIHPVNAVKSPRRALLDQTFTVYIPEEEEEEDLIDDLIIFQTGNLVVFGPEQMFSFEYF